MFWKLLHVVHMMLNVNSSLKAQEIVTHTDDYLPQ